MVTKFLGLVCAILLAVPLWGQSAGALHTQEIYSSTGKVKVDNVINSGVQTIPYAATETFNGSAAQHFITTLTGNVSSSSFTNPGTGEYSFAVCQDGVGSWTFTWPTNFLNTPTIQTAANTCTTVVGFYDGTNFRVSGQWNATGGSGGGGTSAGVSSVGLTGDGVVYNTTVPGSPVTSSGTFAPTLANASVGNVLAGPIGNMGSNVGVRQSVVCTSATTTITCPAFGSPVAVGDSLLVVVPEYTGQTGTFSDSLGNTITASNFTGSAASSKAGFGTVTTGGTDAVTITGVSPFSNCSGNDYAAVAFDLTGASALSAAIANQFSGSVGSYTVAVSALASTDSFIRVGLTSPTSGSCNVSTGNLTIGPVGAILGTLTNANVTNGWGSYDIFAPGNTSSVSNTFNYVLTSGSGVNNRGASLVLDVAQSASAGNAPWVARRLVESDLPASAISAVQSAQTFHTTGVVNLPSATTTTGLSGSITMPSDGCPCRVLVQAGIFLSSTTSANWGWWVTDGTNTFGDGASITTDLHTPPLQISSMSSVAYANNQAVTFSVKINPGTYAGGNTVQVLDTFGSNPDHSWLTLTIMQSRN